MEAETFESLLQKLPLFVQLQVLKYKKWQDQQRCVIGKILLQKGLERLSHISCSLNDLRYTKHQRPFFDTAIDFNIAHANDLTVCAVSEAEIVGIDIEKVAALHLDDFKDQLTESELNSIRYSADSHYSFYRFWTQKEACLKAVGVGLSVPLNQIIIQHNSITFAAQEWFLHEIKLHEQYCCYLCTSTPSPTISTTEVNFGIGKPWC